MTLSSSQRRAWTAMGLGPVWVSRDAVASDVAEDVDVAADDGAARAARIATLDWDSLVETVAACGACGLSRTRTQTVFGVGARRPACLVLGEAPGADEDAQGEPFVGQAGRLLDAMLAAVGFSRADNVFIANTLKCRPPGNRDPLPAESAACRPFLERQIALLDPKMVLVVGKVASHALLGTEAPMASLRGREHRLTIGSREVPVVATYHPAYLLRTPEDKAKTWADLCLAREIHERIAASG